MSRNPTDARRVEAGPVATGAAPAVGWLRATRWLARPQPLFVHRQGVWQPPAPGATDVSGTAFDDLSQWVIGHPGSVCQLVLSGTLTHQLVLRDTDLPLHDDAVLMRYARQQFQMVHGSPAERWPLAVWSDWPQQVAVALHGLDLPALQLLASRHAVRLQRVQPWWSVAWRHVQRNSTWADWATCPRRALLLAEACHTTWIVGDQQGLQSVRQRRLAMPTLSAMAELLGQLQQDDQVDAAATLVAGIGIEAESGAATSLAATVAQGLYAPHPEPAWMQS